MNELTGQMVACFERLDIITASNKKMMERHVQLKEKLVRHNGQKDIIYSQRKKEKIVEV
jgi:hypothetical protein